jgi:hypothetical protein
MDGMQNKVGSALGMLGNVKMEILPLLFSL